MVLEGMVPVLMQTPPTTERDSTIATLFFSLEAATAARCPEGPEPTIIRSYLTALMRSSSKQGRGWYSRDPPHPEANTARPRGRCKVDEDFHRMHDWDRAVAASGLCDF